MLTQAHNLAKCLARGRGSIKNVMKRSQGREPSCLSQALKPKSFKGTMPDGSQTAALEPNRNGSGLHISYGSGLYICDVWSAQWWFLKA